jgi:hypothetical protein
VHLVEATKQVYRAIPVREKKLVPNLKPVLDPVLAPSPGGAARTSVWRSNETPERLGDYLRRGDCLLR